MHTCHVVIGLLLVSCGARSDLDLSAASLADSAALRASTLDGPKSVSPVVDAAPDATLRPGDATIRPVDAGVDAAPPVDAFPPVDAKISGMPCSTPAVVISECGIPACCKFSVTWTCGGQAFSIGGGCQTVAPINGYEGACSVNGIQSSMFNAASTTCLCQDAGALGAFVESLCEVSPPPAPPAPP